MKKLVTPFRVGLLVLVTGGFLFGFILFTRKGGLGKDEALQAYAYFRDASGLGPKSRIQIAGLPVGEVESIKLEGTRAKVTVRIRRLPIRASRTTCWISTRVASWRLPWRRAGRSARSSTCRAWRPSSPRSARSPPTSSR